MGERIMAITDSWATDQDLDLWHLIKDHVAPQITDAFYGFWPEDFEHRSPPPTFFTNAKGDQLESEGTPVGLVLAEYDLQNEEGQGVRWAGGTFIAFSSCVAGYHGQGPRGSQEVLLSAGFSESQADLVFTTKELHIRKGETEPRHCVKVTDI